jgi:hypothetical protein
MKKPRSVVLGLGGFLTVAALVFWACSTTTTPVDQLTDCEKHQTGTLSVTNSSTLGLDYEIILDGTSQGKLAAGATAEYTVGAGPHNVVYRYFGTTQAACSTAYFQITQCQKTSISCSG